MANITEERQWGEHYARSNTAEALEASLASLRGLEAETEERCLRGADVTAELDRYRQSIRILALALEIKRA